MADALNNIIDLSSAIQANDLNAAKVLVNELNGQIDELKERFSIPESQDICNYFSFYELFDNNNNETRRYVTNNFNGLNADVKEAFQWHDNIGDVFTNPTVEKTSAFLDKVFKQEKFHDYQIAAIMRMINYAKRYELLKELKEKGEK